MTETMITRAQSRLSSFDPQSRTVQAVLASEQPVRRRDWETGVYDEILICTPAAIDTARLESMALLDSHNAYEIDARLGTVVPGSLKFENRTAIVTIKLSRNEKGEALFRDLEDGHRLSVSVGYKLTEIERTDAPAGGIAVVKATKWQPMELSVVNIPADPNAMTRAFENTDTKENHMNTEVITRAERKRVSEINALARSAKIDLADEIVTKAIEDGTDINAFRAAMLSKLVDKENESPTFPIVETRGMGDQLQKQTDARVDALVARMTGKAPAAEAREFMGLSLLDHARGLLEAQGVSTRGMSREQILGYRGQRAMHSTSDFPNLLTGAGERILMDAYGNTASPLKSMLSRQSTAKDFRAKTKLKVSGAGLLEPITEGGEIKSTTRSETSESYRIESFGRIFSMSFQAIVNDDLNAFGDWARQAGQMAALTENKVLLDLFLANSGNGPTMGEDSKALFHADHGNLAGAGTALTEVALTAAVLAFRKQTIFGGKIRASVSPKYLVTGPELEMQAQKLVASISPATTGDAVPATIGNLIPVVEPNLDGASFYLFADPAQSAVFEWSYLDGYSGPQIDSRDGFERLGTEFRAVLHFGGGCVDFRGAYRNAGI